ncbi:MAG: hypothetical protein AB1374_07240 [Bacillota bacterium]
MVYVFLVFLFYLVVAYFEVPRMLKNRMFRELYTFTVISVLGFILAAGQILDFPLPNVTKVIEVLFQPLVDATDKLLLPPELRG